MAYSISQFEKIIAEHERQVYNACLGFLKNEEDARDIAQETFIKAYEAIDTFDGRSGLGTWLYRIAMNKCLEFQRKQNSMKRTGTVALRSEHFIISGREYHPGVALENRERSELLYKAIELLPENQKVAFILSKVQGIGQSEISSIMKKSVGSVESLLQRAKENLRKSLKKYYEKS